MSRSPHVHDRCACQARKGTSLRFDVDSIGCNGVKQYTGFSDTISPTFEYFLFCGIPGKIKGERYKKSSDIVKEMMKIVPQYRAPARFLVFKRFDALEETDNPDAVVFFATRDVLGP